MLGTFLSAAAQGLGYFLDYRKSQEQQRQADAAAARQEAHYTSLANQDPLSTSANQHVINQYDRDAQQQIENARGVAAITGATPEYGLAVQKAVANGKANLLGNISAGASQRADMYEQKAEAVRHAKEVADQERTAQQRAGIGNFIANAVSVPIGEFVDYQLGDKTWNNPEYVKGRMDYYQGKMNGLDENSGKYKWYNNRYNYWQNKSKLLSGSAAG